MSIVERPPMDAMIGDPDDHRPDTSWALIVDPGDKRGRVDSLAIIRESIAVGDRIPLHTHDIDEALTVLEGDAETRLGQDIRRVSARAVIFIPAGVPHGTANAGDAPLEIIEIAMLERNPAPGTEGAAPRRSRYDLRTGAFEAIE